MHKTKVSNRIVELMHKAKSRPPGTYIIFIIGNKIQLENCYDVPCSSVFVTFLNTHEMINGMETLKMSSVIENCFEILKGCE